jgi:hypothetical protein
MAGYEVQTEDLIGIRDQLAAQAGLVGSTSSSVVEATSTLLLQLEVGLRQAEATIDGLLQEVAATVQTTGSTAAAADWLGPDSEAFREANADLMAAVSRSQAQLETALTGHRTATTQIGATLLDTLGQFTAEASRSQELTGQLSAAVGAEANSYEQAFNGSWNEAGAVAAAGAATGAPTAATGRPPDGGSPEEEDDWDGIGDPDKEWRKGPEWESKYRNGSGKDPKDLPFSIDPLAEHTFLDEKAEAEVGVLQGSFGDESGLQGSGQLAAAEAKAQVDAKAGISLTDGAFISASAGASAALGAAQGKIGYGPLTAQGQGYLLGAEASADVKAGIGANGAEASLKSEAFAGGKAEAEASAEYGGVTAGVGGEVSYGIGAHANADASFTTDRVGVSVDVGAAIGLGAGVKFDVSVNPGEVLHSLGDLF